MNRLAWFAMLAILPVVALDVFGQDKKPAAPPSKPPVVKPLLPASKPAVDNDIDKRRERMKQRDDEIDRVLREKQRKDAERSRDQKR
jgi:hypothetical protein